MRDPTATKARIEQEALRLFAKKGVKATTTKEIAAASGVSEGTLYLHFTSKNGMVQSLFWDGYKFYGRYLAEALRVSEDPSAQLRWMVKALCHLADLDWNRFSFLLLNQHGVLSGPADREVCNPVEVVRGVVATALADRDAETVDLTTAMVVGIVLQAATFKAYGRLARSMVSMSDEIAAACHRVVFG